MLNAALFPMRFFKIMRYSRSTIAQDRFAWMLCLGFVAPIFIGSTATTSAAPVQETKAESVESNTDAEALATSASNAQNNSDYVFAEKQWAKLIKQYPDWSGITTAQLNLGICQFQQRKYSDAIEPIKSAVVSGDTKLNIPKALLFLGFSQMKYGDELALASSSADRKKGGMYLTTATQTLGKIVKEYPDYENADQALYFQGQAFYKLERYDEAVAAFQNLEAFENAKFKDVAKYDLASTYQQLGNSVAALTAYQQFRDSIAPDDTATLDDVDLQVAKLKMNLAGSASQRGAAAEAKQGLEEASALLERIVETPSSTLWAEACFNQAICKGELKDFQRSAELFAKVAAVKESPYAAQSAVLAGREWIRAKDYPRAIKELTPIANATDSKFGLQAAILLANALRNAGQPDKASAVTEAWLERSKDDPLHVALLMERAEAAYATPKMKKLAGEQFLDIATRFPDDAAAPEALYNATAAFWESFETDQAIESANQFLTKYPLSPFAADVQEILGDASLIKEDFVNGEKTFRTLAENYPQHPNFEKWTLRIGWALYLQKKFAETEAWLKPNLEKLKSPKLKSEALHWIGASQYQQKKFNVAEATLKQSLDSIQRWKRIDETMLTLLRTQLALNNLDGAKLMSEKIASQFPESPATPESIFRIGEALYDQSEFADALVQYDRLLTQFPESEFVATAMFGKGWSLLRTGQFEPAEQTFSQLIERFPTIALAEQARMGRSVAHRKLGKSDEAIKDLQTFLETAPEGERKTSSLFELGLAHVENENWAQAEETFRSLLTLPDDHRLADRTRYELAWVLDSQEKNKEAADQFQELAEKFPESQLAAESNFKVATQLYDDEKFEAAASAYQKSLDSPNVSKELAEKAVYKLGWSYYKLGDFSDAVKAFERQTKDFPTGDLIADGSFMLAQSQFQNADYDNALKAYTVAKPILMKSNSAPDRLKWLTMLNGAKSANALKQWQEAIDFATPLTTASADETLAQDAWFEIGQARMGLKQEDGAIDAWGKAAVSTGKTGARARVMKGDLLFRQKRFEDAINEFKLVFYGYGGSQSTAEIRPLQAYAVYEAARCSYVRISEASERLRPELINDAQKHFLYLIENYPDQELATEAKKQLETLKKIQQRN